VTRDDPFSYAAAGDPLFKRLAIRLIERMTGQPQLRRLYREYQAGVPSADFWQEAVRRLKLKLVFETQPLENWPTLGPLMMVSNHPFTQATPAVAPVYFEGQNSRLFQIASHIHLTLRLSLLFKEAHDRIGGTVVMHPRPAMAYAALAPLGGGRVLMDHLRGLTYALAPSRD
jgi:hypothetical protein